MSLDTRDYIDIELMTPSEIKNELMTRRLEIHWLHCCIEQHLQTYKRPEFVPCKIRINRRIVENQRVQLQPGDYDCESNRWGAIKVKTPEGTWQGIKPIECQVLQMRFNE